MKKLSLLTCTTLLLMASEPKVGVETLSDSVRSLLSQEMIALQKGMQEVLSMSVRGDFEGVTAKATQIQNSFILKQKLSDAQRKELKAKVPKEFIALDRSFHEKAGELANAAEFGDTKQIAQIYGEMMQKCMQCHSTFAKSRFSNFE